MDLIIVSTGEKIYKVDEGAGRALLAMFPEAIQRITPKAFNVTPTAPTAAKEPGKLQYNIHKDEMNGGARLKIACPSCGFNTSVFPLGWKAALTVAKDV